VFRWAGLVSSPGRLALWAEAFDALVRKTDFEKEVAQFKSMRPPFRILFNAYFVTESELVTLSLQKSDSCPWESGRG
jgi:hypothetical protein